MVATAATLVCKTEMGKVKTDRQELDHIPGCSAKGIVDASRAHLCFVAMDGRRGEQSALFILGGRHSVLRSYALQ